MMDVYKVADGLQLLPMPRELDRDEGTHSLDGCSLVATADHRFTEIAIAEINQRITDLDHDPLPVHQRSADGPRVLLGRWFDPEIRETALALDVTVTPSDPGEQGYVIDMGRVDEQLTILLAGSDAQGLLYAAITFCQLLDAGHDGPHIPKVSIRDWPDFKVRNIARLDLGRLRQSDATVSDLSPLDNVVEELKADVDFWLRHKVNCLYSGWFFPDEDTPPALYEAQADRARAVIDYAHQRGIDIRYVGNVDIGEYLPEEWRERAIERAPGQTYEWAAFDAHLANARRYASFVGESDHDIVSIHLDDQGGYLDPERWSERTEETRDRYGDDRVWATEEQFQLYFTPLEDGAGDVSLEAIPYPYHFQFARDDFPDMLDDLRESPALAGLVSRIADADEATEIHESLSEYHRELASRLPTDVSIVFREAHRRTFEAATELYPDHPFTIWVYPDRNFGWKGTFTSQVRMAKTFYREDARDTFFLASAFPYGDGRVQRLAQQEYAWGTDRPDGTRMFTQRKRSYEVGGSATGFQRVNLIPTITNILYDEASDAIQGLLAASASFRYVATPEETAVRQHDTENFHYIYERMERQADEFAEAHEELDAFLDTEAAENLDPHVEQWVRFYHRYTGLAKLKAEIESNVDEFYSVLTSGRMHEAIGVGESGLKSLPEHQETRDQLINEDATLPNRIDELDDFVPLNYEPRFARLISTAEAVRDEGGLTHYLEEEAGEGIATVDISVRYRRDRTVTYGYATVIGLDVSLIPVFEIWDDLAKHELRITVQSNGETIHEDHWRGHKLKTSFIEPRPVTMDLGDPFSGDLTLEIALGSEVLDTVRITEDGELVEATD